MKRRSGFGWLEMITGFLLIMLGILTFCRPGSVFTAFVILYGLIAIFTGVIDLVFYARMERYMGIGSVISLVTGVLSIMVGFLLLIYPGTGQWAVTILFPLWFLAHCVSRLFNLPLIRLRAGDGYYYFVLAVNIVGIILAFLMMMHPLITYLSVNFIMGIYLILTGIDSIVLAFSHIGE